jgi:hypothetical protein
VEGKAVMTEDDMAIDPTSILTPEEMQQARTPDELAQWVNRKIDEFDSPDPAVKQYGRLRMGLAKQLDEEVGPLSLLAAKLYGGRSDVLCIPNLDTSKDFDAVIRDGSVTPPAEVKVEVTLASDDDEGRDEHLRRKYLHEHRHVTPLGKVVSTGTKRTGLKTDVEEDFPPHAELLQKFSLIRKAAERKRIPGRYGKTHVLIIFFDDNWLLYDPERDVMALADFVKRHVLPLRLNFRTVYVLGRSGWPFLPYKLTNA